MIISVLTDAAFVATLCRSCSCAHSWTLSDRSEGSILVILRIDQNCPSSVRSRILFFGSCWSGLGHVVRCDDGIVGPRRLTPHTLPDQWPCGLGSFWCNTDTVEQTSLAAVLYAWVVKIFFRVWRCKKNCPYRCMCSDVNWHFGGNSNNVLDVSWLHDLHKRFMHKKTNLIMFPS